MHLNLGGPIIEITGALSPSLPRVSTKRRHLYYFRYPRHPKYENRSVATPYETLAQIETNVIINGD